MVPCLLQPMTSRRLRSLAASCLFLSLAAGAWLPPAEEEPRPLSLDPERVSWRQLEFRVRKLTMKATTDIEWALLPAKDVVAAMMPAAEGVAIEPDGPQVLRLTMDTTFLGKRSLTDVWIDPRAGQAFQWTKREYEKRARLKSYRFTEEGVYQLRRKPVEGSGDVAEEWPVAKELWDEYPAWLGDHVHVSEATALLYIVAAAELDEPGDLVQVPIFSTENLILVDFRVVGVERVKVDYEEVSGGPARQVKETIDVLEISIDAGRLGPTSTEDNLELMGMKGDVRVFLERESRIPVQLSGRVPVAGRTKIRVRRAVLR